MAAPSSQKADLSSASSSSGETFFTLLGVSPTSSRFQSHLSALQLAAGISGPPTLETKTYPDISYRNLRSCGTSYQFEPRKGSGKKATQADESELKLCAVDVYNHQVFPPEQEGETRQAHADVKSAPARAPDKAKKDTWELFPSYPILIPRASIDASSGAALGAEADAGAGAGTETAAQENLPLEVRPSTTGADFVAALGEPSRKGGGTASASGLGTGVWLEWEELGVMVELGGQRARGAQRWEKDQGGASRWAVLTIMEPKLGEKGK